MSTALIKSTPFGAPVPWCGRRFVFGPKQDDRGDMSVGGRAALMCRRVTLELVRPFDGYFMIPCERVSWRGGLADGGLRMPRIRILTIAAACFY